jgi:RNA polymerase sigma-70 factor, ECF subfamily
VSSALVDQSGLPRGGAGGHDDDLLRELHDQPTGDASEQVVPCHLVAAALGRLTQEHRDVLQECYFRGSSVARAALELGIAPGTVKCRTYYALRALRLAIEELREVE